MGYPMPSGSSNSRIPRPAATTWQEQEEYDAQDKWNEAGQWTNADRTAAAGRRDAASAAGGAAIDSYNNRPVAPNLSGWSPDATKGYQASQVANWMSSMTMQPTARAAQPTRAVIGGAGSAGGATSPAFESTNLKALDTSSLDNFDPTAAGNTFAQGAMGQFKNQLADELESYDTDAIRAGRFRTGQFDVDKGKVVSRVASDFDSKLAQAALDFSGQRLNAITAGTQARTTRASEMDANARALAELNANLGFDREKMNTETGLAYDKLGLDQYGAETDRYRLGLQGAEFGDQMGFDRASALDKYGFERASTLDATGEARARTGLDAALDREKFYGSDYHNYADAAANYTSANRDWASQNRTEQDARDLLKKRLNPWGNGPGTASGGASSASSPADSVNAQIANSFGVPFKKY